jgi:hypothetical protein
MALEAVPLPVPESTSLAVVQPPSFGTGHRLALFLVRLLREGQTPLRRLERAELPATGALDPEFVRDLFAIYGQGDEDDRAAAAERAIARGWTVEELSVVSRMVYNLLKAEADHEPGDRSDDGVDWPHGG